jgi:Transport and Golgi organisation 2
VTAPLKHNRAAARKSQALSRTDPPDSPAALSPGVPRASPSDSPRCLFFGRAAECGDDGFMCTVVVSFEPTERVPPLLLGARDELTDRPWQPLAPHWPGSPLFGGLDEQAGRTWLAAQPDLPRVSCLLNGCGAPADPARRRSRGELPLRAAADSAGVLKELAEAPGLLAAYDPFLWVPKTRATWTDALQIAVGRDRLADGDSRHL